MTNLYEALAVIDNLLSDGPKVIVLKNGAICKLYAVDYTETPMGDLDLLIDPTDFENALLKLLKNNFKLKFRSNLKASLISVAIAEQEAELEYECADGTQVYVELQTRSVSGRWLNPANEPSYLTLVKNCTPLKGFKNMNALTPEWNIVQVCLHTAKHSYTRAPGFRLHADVDRIVSNERNINWSVFVEYVRGLEVPTPIYLSLKLAKDLLETKIPNEVLKTLKPKSYRIYLILYILRRVGLFTQTKSDLIISHIFYSLCFIMKILSSSIDPSEKVLTHHCLEVRVVN